MFPHSFAVLDRISILLSALLATTLFASAEYQQLHAFKKSARAPVGDLIQVADGEFLGIASRDGAHDVGEIFKITANGTFTTLYSLKEIDAFEPSGGLVRGADGAFYGCARGGGLFHSGTFFRVTASGEFAVLHHFRNPSYPSGPLCLGPDGAFYGFTERGGVEDGGTLFKITAGGALTVLHEFHAIVSGALTLASDGNLYGGVQRLSLEWPPPGDLVIKVTPAGQVTFLHDFTQVPPVSSSEPATPTGRLVEAADGNLYGVLQHGGADYAGAAYRISPAGDYEVVHEFSTDEGANPIGLWIGNDGLLYGLFSNVSGPDPGALFRMTLTGEVAVLHQFKGGNEGSKPTGLTLGSDGNFYGATAEGGTAKNGTIFRSATDGGTTTLASLTDDGVDPRALVFGPDAYYGFTTEGGRYGAGTFFRMRFNDEFTVLTHFQSAADALTALVSGPDSTVYGGRVLYGTSSSGSFARGYFFQLNTNNGARTVLYAAAPSAYFQISHLVAAEEGTFYGIQSGMDSMFGFQPDSIVRLTRSGTFTILKSFGAPAQVAGPLAIGGDRNIYGQSVGGFFLLTSGGEFNYLPSNLEDRSIFSGLVRGPDGAMYYVGSKVLRLDLDGIFQEVAPAGHGAGGPVISLEGYLFAGNDAVIERIDPKHHRRAILHAFSRELEGSGVSALSVGIYGGFNVATRFGGPGGGGAIGHLPFGIKAPLGGDYFGVLKGTWGTLRVTLTAEGQLSGVLNFAGEKFIVRKALDGLRVASFRFARVGKPEILLELTFGSDAVGGVLSEGESTYTVVAERAPWIAGTPAPQAGKYTIALDPTSPLSSDLPAGSGYAVMTVKPNGRIAIAGRLADGIPFSAGSVLASDGTFPLLGATPKGSIETITGNVNVTFRESVGYADCDAELTWRREARQDAARYKTGFSLDIRLLGSRYTPPTSWKSVLALDAEGHASLVLGIPASGLETPNVGVSIPIIIAPQSVILQPPLLSLTIDPANGLFAGTFDHPADHLPRAIRGAFLQKENRGAGYFIGPSDAGAVSIVPAE